MGPAQEFEACVVPLRVEFGEEVSLCVMGALRLWALVFWVPSSTLGHTSHGSVPGRGEATFARLSMKDAEASLYPLCRVKYRRGEKLSRRRAIVVSTET